MTSSPAVAAVVARLAADGFAVAAGYFDQSLCRSLAVEAAGLATDPLAIDAGVGRAHEHHADAAVRQARIRWMDPATPGHMGFLAEANGLQVALNRQLFLGLRSFEGQLALTPAGGFYRRHLDSFQGKRNRIVSLVAYLNDGWDLADGGCLRIWPSGHGVGQASGAEMICEPIDVMPHCATLVLMLSEETPHEVLPCRRPRASIAGWFRIDDPEIRTQP